MVFHTNTAWPLENAIRIPAQDQPFVVKYTPGFPRNFVILTNESPHGIAQARASARERVEVAARKLHFSPGNAGFRADYRRELESWLRDHGNDPQQQSTRSAIAPNLTRSTASTRPGLDAPPDPSTGPT